MNFKRKDAISKTIVYIILILYSIVTFIPFIWAILTSLKPMAEIVASDTFFPKTLTFDAYGKVFSSGFIQALTNSLAVSGIITFINLLVNTATGYALARLKFMGKNIIFQLLLLLIMVPAQVTMIPAYIIVSRLGLVNTHFSLILTGAVSISYIFLMRQFFVDFPKDVEEAAELDGMNKFQFFIKIVLPMARPALATQGIFTFMGVWNEFMKPLLYLQTPEKYMLTQYLNAAAKQYAKSSAWNITMAGSIISIVPILLIYIFLNKYFVTLNDQGSGSK
jgi:ABC-type sugar transport system, permease component